MGLFWPLRPLAASEIVESASAGSFQLVQVIICQIKKKISFLAQFKVPKTPWTKFFPRKWGSAPPPFKDNPENIGKNFFKNWQILAINQERLANSSDKHRKIGKF